MKRPDWLPGINLRLWRLERGRSRLDRLTDVLRDYESCLEGPVCIKSIATELPDVGKMSEPVEVAA